MGGEAWVTACKAKGVEIEFDEDVFKLVCRVKPFVSSFTSFRRLSLVPLKFGES
jgi:hypothetical protein